VRDGGMLIVGQRVGVGGGRRPRSSDETLLRHNGGQQGGGCVVSVCEVGETRVAGHTEGPGSWPVRRNLKAAEYCSSTITACNRLLLFLSSLAACSAGFSRQCCGHSSREGAHALPSKATGSYS
jgi:hypothetical protein